MVEGFLVSSSNGNSMASIGLCSLDCQPMSPGVVFMPAKQVQMPPGRSQSATDVSAYSTKWLVSPQLSTTPGVLSPPPSAAAPALPRTAPPSASEPQIANGKAVYHNSDVEKFKAHQQLEPMRSTMPLLGSEAEEKLSVERRPSGSSRKFIRSSPDGHPSQYMAEECEMAERALSTEPQKTQDATGHYETPIEDTSTVPVSPSRRSNNYYTESQA